MKPITKRKRALKTVVTLLLFFFTHISIVAQSILPISVEDTQSDAAFGPTIIIASNINASSSNYGRSKSFSFSQPAMGSLPVYNNGTPSPTQIGNAVFPADQTKNLIIKVGHDGDGNYLATSGAAIINTGKEWTYLDEAINTFIGLGYRRFIILEGDYLVNGSIIIDNINGSTASTAKGKITIEGEGFGTRIKNDPAIFTTGNIIEVRSNFNTIKNLSIISSANNTCLALTTANSSVDVRNNVFENLYFGDQAMYGNTNAPNSSLVTSSDAAPLDTANIRKGIQIVSSGKQVGFNRFINMTFYGLDKAIELSGSFRLHDNVFENMSFDNTIVGVDFLANVQATDNVFTKLAYQAESYSKNLARNITGRHNTFSNCNFNDWGSSSLSQNNNVLFKILSSAEHTTIQNSECSLNATIYLNDAGLYTQLINNFGGNGDVTNKFGNNKNSANLSAISSTEIQGKLKLSANDANNATTFSAGRVLTTDANGNATWTALTANTATAWDYNASKNIRLNGWAINYGDNTTTNTTIPGIRIGSTGNVRIGTLAPTTTDGSLQVDGNFVSNYNSLPQLTARNGKVIVGNTSAAFFSTLDALDPAYKLIVNGKVRVKDEVLVQPTGLSWPDYVFEKGYKKMSIEEVALFVATNKHLPNMPTAKEVEQNGIEMGKMIQKQQEKIEELMLYIIELKSEVEQMKSNNAK